MAKKHENESTQEAPEASAEKSAAGSAQPQPEAVETPAQIAARLREMGDDELVALSDEAAKSGHWLDVARRAQAELENTIKRLRRDQEDAMRYANTGLARDLLPVLDNLARALQSAEASKDFEGLFKGLGLTSKLFTDALARHQVLPIDSAGKPFDPALHDAVMMASDDKLADNVVAQELERGWTLHDRVLRAAKVSVNKKP